MNKNIYVIKRDNSYVSTIYRNSTSTASDIGEAIEFSTLEIAKAVIKLLENMGYHNLKLYAITTAIEEVNLEGGE